ncbi:zinc finger CCHC domain-containing protein 8 homolog [Arctopsyche grandis]|uniref:zinc finger CCHC domain-containing protein 8 homolog n=1 Tax=Arctopsyche grandis TaxID=121162 RepID=UPI00406D78B9
MLDVNDEGEERGREPLMVVEFRDREAAAALSESVAVALRGVASITTVDFDPERPLLLYAWGTLCHADPDSSRPSLDNALDTEMPLFIEDTRPATLNAIDIPTYTKKYSVLEVIPAGKELNKNIIRRSQDCFNCEGNHTLRDCPHPKDFNKINQRRKEMKMKAVRYHADEQNQGDGKIPGQISGDLRKALGLKKHQLPLHIYRMRIFGYPPGWLINARITHSGLTLFDSQGKEVQESDDEKSADSNSKDKYDVKKILNFPGFNVPPSSKCIDESENLGYPPFNEENSKMTMLEKLAPIAAKAYRRKKMSQVKPERQPGDEQLSADMDIDDDDDDEYGFSNRNEYRVPFVPPLPPDSPPPLLPPIVFPPPPIVFPLPPPTELTPLSSIELPTSNPSVVNYVTITISDSSSSLEEIPQCSSPSLDDLEAQKLSLIAALEEKIPSPPIENDGEIEKQAVNSTINLDSTIENSLTDNIDCNTPKSTLNTSRQGEVRESDMGTPVLSFTPYFRLPSCDSFSKNICDVLNFENLPDSTGKYGQMSGIIKKVREAVTKINQDQ